MKILVMFTGGTIGSVNSNGFAAPDRKANYTLLENYKGDAEFETVNLLSMLSENLTATEIEQIVSAVFENQNKGYDGIIITHGTDTLQYTAAALALCLPKPKLPIVLVSANYPLEFNESNGNANFEAAVEFIKAKCQNGVFVSYKNTLSDWADIHYGTRLYTHLENTDEIYSFGNNPFAFYKDGVITVNDNYKPSATATQNTPYRFIVDPKILVIDSRPGGNFNYDLADTKAVLIKPYHSGTVNTLDGGLKRLCKQATELNVPVYILGSGLRTTYESTRVFSDYNLKVLPATTFVCAYMKLWIAISNDICVDDFISANS